MKITSLGRSHKREQRIINHWLAKMGRSVNKIKQWILQIRLRWNNTSSQNGGPLIKTTFRFIKSILSMDKCNLHHIWIDNVLDLWSIHPEFESNRGFCFYFNTELNFLDIYFLSPNCKFLNYLTYLQFIYYYILYNQIIYC